MPRPCEALERTEIDVTAIPIRPWSELVFRREWLCPKLPAFWAVISKSAIVSLCAFGFYLVVEFQHIVPLLLFPLAVVVAVSLSKKIAEHYITWLMASPRISSEIRQGYLSQKGLYDSAGTGWLTVLVGGWCVFYLLWISSIAPQFRNLGSPVLGVCLLVVLGFSLCGARDSDGKIFGTQPCFPRSLFAALACWFTRDVPFEFENNFQSPVGERPYRNVLLLGTLTLLAMTALPLANFFPLLMFKSSVQPFANAISDPGLIAESKNAFEEKTNQYESERADLAVQRSKLGSHLIESKMDRLSRDFALTTQEMESSRRQWDLKQQHWNELESLRASGYGELQTTPLGWTKALYGSGDKNWSLFLRNAIVSVAASLVMPALSFFLIFSTVAVTPIERAERFILSLEALGAMTESDWEGYVTKLQNSEDALERESLWMGTHALPGLDIPVLLTRASLAPHAVIRGASGSGKTSTAIMRMLVQLTRMAGRDQDSSILVIDLKGDRALFNTCRIEAERAGLPFKWFTNKRGHSSFGFNPFLQSHFRDNLTLNQRTEIFLKAMGLYHGETYGKAYFGSMHQLVLRSYLEHPEIDSFKRLEEFIRRFPELYPGSKKDLDDARHLMATLDTLSSIDQLNISPSTMPGNVVENAIDVPSLLDEPQVLYFHLQALTEVSAVQTVAKLALFSLLTAAADREPGTGNRVYTFIDEFQRIQSADLDIFLQQARSYGISCLLAHQSISDLKNNDFDISDIVEENTNVKIDFTGVSLEHKRYLVESSDEVLEQRMSYSTSDDGKSSTSTQFVPAPRYTGNEVTDVSADPLCCFLKVVQPDGYSQFGGYTIPVDLMYPISKAEYERRMTTPWPKADNELGSFAVGGREAEPVQRLPSPGPKQDAAKIAAVSIDVNDDSFDFQSRAKELLHSLSGERENGAPSSTVQMR